MIQVTFMINTKLNIETIHQDDLQDWLDDATHHNITIIHIDSKESHPDLDAQLT